MTGAEEPRGDAVAQLPQPTRIAVAPPDLGRSLRQFLDQWTPDAAVWLGELRPFYLMQCHRRGIPQLWADARITGPQAWRLRWAPAAGLAPMRSLRAILTGPGPDAERLARVPGLAERLETPGFLKRGAPALPCDLSERDAMAQILAARPVWCAADIAPGEVDAVLHAHYLASRQSHRLLLILVPEEDADGPALRERVEAGGWRAALRSEGEDPGEEVQVLIADQPDELGLWYRLAPVSFLGQTLAGRGCGRSPFEPAALGSAILHGPATGYHKPCYSRLSAAGATCQVDSAQELGRHLGRLLSPEASAEMANRAWQVTTEGAVVTDRIVELLEDMLDSAEAA